MVLGSHPAQDSQDSFPGAQGSQTRGSSRQLDSALLPETQEETVHVLPVFLAFEETREFESTV
jgi:hypothetical protein